MLKSTADQTDGKWQMPEVSQALSESITFMSEDFEVLDLALRVSPELRFAAFILKLARAANIQYPVTSIDDIVTHIPSGRIGAAGHVVTGESLRIFFPREFLPIESQGDLLTKAYLTLLHCQEETNKVTGVDPVILDYIVDFINDLRAGVEH
ncbi:hypothetical protein AB0L00_23005 [Actinoallomurus sp. NPDC052308]|uniref:hypothetical protein n=1 Tax=Actinoallomurus sp. NPDC052308 TaxID=3155530 RepID=UPI003440BD1D